jgi:SAM-dependent methyltransferase
VAELGLPLAGRRILDLGCGPGHFTEALRRAGAEVHPLELDAESLLGGGEPPAGAVQGDASVLPFADGTFDGIFCSNMLEHTPSPAPVLAEIGRVLRPGGWAWVSWTNWYSPWGGHEIVPFHYLGPERGLRVWRRLYGEPRKNVPFVELWPTHIGAVLKTVAAEPTLVLRDTKPRYYPSQRWITKVPGFREVFTWNCVLLLERSADRGAAAATAARPDASARPEAVRGTVIDLRDAADGLGEDRAVVRPGASSA